MFILCSVSYAALTAKRRGTLSLVGALSVILSTSVTQAAIAAGKTLNESVVPLSQARASGAQVMGIPKPEELVEFQVALKMRNFPNLEDRIAAGDIISEAEMADKYYPTATDYQTVSQWLTKQGLKIKQTFPNHLTVEVEGRVSQVEQALSISFQAVKFEGKRYVSTFSAPKLPQNVAQLIVGTNHLQPYQRVYPHHISNVSSSDFNSQISTAPYLVNEIKSAYNATNLTQSGTNQKIAILIDRFPLNSDLTKFWLANSVPQSLSNIEKVPVVSNIPTTPEGEETLDVEWSSSIAPASHVRTYAVGTLSFSNLDKGFQKIIADLPTQPTLHQLSISLGACENDLTPSQLQTDDQFLAVIASQGVTVFVSSGDDGASGNCSNGTIGVDFPAADPNVTAVGGTSLNAPNPDDVGSLGSETAWEGSGGGISNFFYRPSWQPNEDGACQDCRLVPDVALEADPKTGAYVVLQGKVNTFGGTSLSAPIWAGFNALINQARASTNERPLGLLGPRIYNLLQTNNFRDITSGCNSLNSTSSYCAGPGYDLVTGIGVPQMDTLLPTLVSQP